MRLLLLVPMLLSLSCGQSYAETACERARSHASSTQELVALATANGITISRKDQAYISRCFKQAKRKHR